MHAYDLTPPPAAAHHQCHGYRDGEWIVYACRECDYEMREHRETGEMKVKNVKMQIRHSGAYVAPEFYGCIDSLN